MPDAYQGCTVTRCPACGGTYMRAEIKPNDTLLVTLPTQLTATALAQLTKELTEQHKGKVIVCHAPCGTTIEVKQ